FFSSRRRHTRFSRDWSSDVCSSDLERFGRLRSVLGPGINFVVPFLDRIAHKVSVLERQLPTASQDAITADNVLVKVETSVFYRRSEERRVGKEWSARGAA